jgi:hypothetical protein
MDSNAFAEFAVVVVGTAAAFATLGVAVHYYWHRFVRNAPRVTPFDDARFSRLEQSVDAIAVEVERIAEGQRFITRLHAAAADQILPAQRQPHAERREITPVS